MSEAWQVAMARLYTEPSARYALYRGDTSAFEAGDLSPADVAALRKFACDNRDRLEVYTAILVKKKSERAKKHLALLSAALEAASEDGWNRIWAMYYESTGGRVDPSFEDGEHGLLAFVERSASELGVGESLVRDALVYERLKREVAAATQTEEGRGAHPQPGCPWIWRPFAIEDFRHDLLALLTAGRERQEPGRLRPTKIVFCRHQTQSSIATARATGALVALIAACDGQTTVPELAGVLRRAGVARASEASVASAVEELAKAGIVGVPKARN
jgi:hypothetical protein